MGRSLSVAAIVRLGWAGVNGGMRYNSVGGWAVVNGAMTWPSGQHTCGTQPLLCASMNSRFGG